MRPLYTNKSFADTCNGVGRKINIHLAGLDETKKDDNQKILEVRLIGKRIGIINAKELILQFSDMIKRILSLDE